MHRGKAIAASAVAAVALLLMLWGSGSGTPVLSSPTGRASPASGPPRSANGPDTVLQTVDLQDVADRAAPNLDWLMLAFALIALAIVVKFLQWLLQRDWEQSEAPEEDDLSDDLDLLLKATSETARGTALAEGEPRNVVVRSWVALEDAASASGLARDPAETAAEFTRRFLGTWQVDEATTQELGELYREARFSRHPVPRHTSDRAVLLVGRIHEQLRVAKARSERAADTPPATGGEDR